MNFQDLGFYRIAALSPVTALGDPLANAERVMALARRPETQGSSVLVFPELFLTGYTCEDLFHNSDLLDETRKALAVLTRFSAEIPGALVVGAPYRTYD